MLDCPSPGRPITTPLQVQVDKGAIKFVLSGAHIMCPGLTSPGAKLPEEDSALPNDVPVRMGERWELEELGNLGCGLKEREGSRRPGWREFRVKTDIIHCH